MGRNTTGPPCSVTAELLLDWRRQDVIAWPALAKPPAGPPWSVTDADRRRQTPMSKTTLPLSYNLCRRASNKRRAIRSVDDVLEQRDVTRSQLTVTAEY